MMRLTDRRLGATIEMKDAIRLPLCKDPKARLVVELEPVAVTALLDDSYEDLKAWTAWELAQDARSPLRLSLEGLPERAGSWLQLYRIEMRCEQAEVLRNRSDELGDILEAMSGQSRRDTGAALKRAARAFYQAIRTCRRVRSQ